VDVFDCVDVDVGTSPPPRRIRSSTMGRVVQGLVATDPIVASSKSQRMVLLRDYTSKSLGVRKGLKNMDPYLR
jgi:hypothetical protein